MKMNVQRRLALVMMVLAAFVFAVGAAFAGGGKKTQHHNSGHGLVGERLKTNGTHQLDKKGKHTVSAEVKGGKIAAFHVKHETKGEISVKKYRSKTKVALLDREAPAVPAQTDLGTTYIAYAYLDDDGNEEYYWFPAEEILDPSGAIEYVPLN
jgi:hypothetical protein